MNAPRKRQIDEISHIIEPGLTTRQRGWLDEGIRLFNSGQPWHAHEEWENLWRTMPDGPAGDAEIILRGLIQLAAGRHLLQPGREEGATGNFRKAREKLALAPPVIFGIATAPLLAYLDRQLSGLDPSLPCRIGEM